MFSDKTLENLLKAKNHFEKLNLIQQTFCKIKGEFKENPYNLVYESIFKNTMPLIKITVDGKEVTTTQELQDAVLAASKKSKVWQPSEGESFFRIGANQIVLERHFKESDHRFLVSIGNVFPSHVAAQKELTYRQALTRVKNYIAENDLGKEWKSSDQNYYLFSKNGRFEIDYLNYSDGQHQVGYLKSFHACDQVIKNCESDLKIIWGIN